MSIERIREALAAGPTPGPWTVMPANAGEQCVARINAWESVPPNGVELAHDTIDAAFIAACHPAAIRELLAERDALKAENESLKHENHNLKWAIGTEGYEQMATPEEQAEHDKAVQAHNEFIARLEKGKTVYEELKADAERYRWLRGDSCPDHSSRWTQWEVRCWKAPSWTGDLRRADLDDAIDAARGKE